MNNDNGKWINDSLAEEGPQRPSRFIARNGDGLRGGHLIITFVLCVLAALAVITGIFYFSRISNVSKEDAGKSVSGPAYGQLDLDLGAPTGITVTVNKGATIKWQAEEDSRVLGYNVYRFTGEDDKGAQINSAIVSDPVYFDDEGTMFNSYAVAAVDTDGRQGALSGPVQAAAEPSSLASLTPTRPAKQIEDFTFEDDHSQAGLPADWRGCTANGMAYIGVWYEEHYAEVTGGILMVTPYYGDSFSYTFTGDSVTVISTRHWNYGIMAVYVDGQLRQDIDLYSAQLQPDQPVFNASKLGEGVHTIKLECTGRKNPQADFTFINVEALEIK